MEEYKRKKQNIPFLVFLLIAAIYFGYCLGPLADKETDLLTLRQEIGHALSHPLPFHFGSSTLSGIGIAMAVWLLFFLTILSNDKKYMFGREYGSARVAEPKELNEVISDENPHNNKILSEELRMSLSSSVTKRNNNVLVIGGSGSGKSFYVVKPNALNLEGSYIFTDPKGEMLRDLGNYLRDNGYNVLVLNLVDMKASDGYNPFAYLRTDSDVIKLITNLINNTTPKNASSSDPFWQHAEELYLQAIMYYVWYEFPKMGRVPSFRGLLEMLNKARIPQNEKEYSELDRLMYALPPDHPALIAYKKVRSGAVDTVRSIIISANARLAYMQNEDLLRILDRDDMDIPFLGQGVYENPKRKSALFCVIPDTDTSFNFVVGMLYSQIFQELFYTADHNKDGKLAIGVAFWMDEFANTALPDDFGKILATCRSREISCNIIIQNIAQLKELFKDSWENLVGNCDTLIYLGGNEQGSHKYISELLGKETIDKRSTGQTLGEKGSSSRNYDVLGRDLMSPDEVRKIDNRYCVVFVRGFDPVVDEKYKTYEKPEYLAAQKLGPYEHGRTADDLYEEGKISFYVDQPGPDGIGKSYRFQVENYYGIFEESVIYKEYLIDTEEGLLIPKDKLGGYTVDGDDDLERFYPVFSPQSMQIVHSGKLILHKHPIIGAYTQIGLKDDMADDEIRRIYSPDGRVTAPMMNSFMSVDEETIS